MRDLSSPAILPEATAFCLASGPATGTAMTWQFQLQQISQTEQNKHVSSTAGCMPLAASACSKETEA